MKKKLTKIVSIILLFSMMLGMLSTANAAVQASHFFSATEVLAVATGSGKVTVEVEIMAAHTMDKVGTLSIQIWERQSDGTYQKVATYSGGMLATNTMHSYATRTYHGTAGTKYYAVAKLYAKDSTGSETMYQYSNTVTAN